MVAAVGVVVVLALEVMVAVEDVVVVATVGGDMVVSEYVKNMILPI